MKISYEVIGIKEFRAKIDMVLNTCDNEVEKIVLKNTIELQSNAKSKAKKDTGFLAGSISVKTINKGMTGVVSVGAIYGAYIEFGTRGQVNVPSGYEEMAAVFKGSRGGMPPPEALKGWAARHGLAGKEFLIARAIARRGTKPQPFLIPAYEKQQTYFMIDIVKLLKKLEGEF